MDYFCMLSGLKGVTENNHIEKLTQYFRHMKKLKLFIMRIGVIGFMFFLIKGLIWLAIFLGLGNLIIN